MSVWNRIQYPEKKIIIRIFRDTSVSICIVGMLSFGISNIMNIIV